MFVLQGTIITLSTRWYTLDIITTNYYTPYLGEPEFNFKIVLQVNKLQLTAILQQLFILTILFVLLFQDGGVYYCKAENIDGAIQSRSANLRIPCKLWYTYHPVSNGLLTTL